MGFRRILIAVDGEPIAAHAADIGVELARSLGAELALIHVVEPPSGPDAGIIPDGLMAQIEQDGKRLLAGFRQRLSLQPSALEFVQKGIPSTEIVRAAKAWPADLIVIGSHGRAGIVRTLLGSVAEGVMRHASCPVLVVRANM
jgi:nucleotide-binding universal stress UspA family protein